MAVSTPNLIYGAATVALLSIDELRDRLNILQKHHVNILDSASIYPGSEATLGQHDVSRTFRVDTKAPGLAPGRMSRESVLKGMEKSLKDLGVDSIDLYYLHSPDTATPIEETLSAIQELYATGKFKHFGISNYLPEDVQRIYDIQSAANSVLPTVFQGNYNAVARHVEDDLFPLLRRLHMSFYAYSPIAGGFLVKESAQLRSNDVEGRFSGKGYTGEMYPTLYGKEHMYQALDDWSKIARDAGISKAALAYRWIAYHSALKRENGDGVVFGSRTTSQLEETLTAIEAGRLDPQIADRASAVWRSVKHDAPRDNWNDFLGLTR